MCGKLFSGLLGGGGSGTSAAPLTNPIPDTDPKAIVKVDDPDKKKARSSTAPVAINQRVPGLAL